MFGKKFCRGFSRMKSADEDADMHISIVFTNFFRVPEDSNSAADSADAGAGESRYAPRAFARRRDADCPNEALQRLDRFVTRFANETRAHRRSACRQLLLPEDRHSYRPAWQRR